jgi:hypothetical protein
VLLSPGVAVWLSGVVTVVGPLTVPPAPDGAFGAFAWPDVSPCDVLLGAVLLGAGGALCGGAGWDGCGGCSVGAGSLDDGAKGAVGVCPSADGVVPSATAGRPNGVATGRPSEAWPAPTRPCPETAIVPLWNAAVGAWTSAAPAEPEDVEDGGAAGVVWCR